MDMRVVVNIKDNKFKLEDGAIIRAKDLGGEFVIEANSLGLISLAKHLLILASDKFESGEHIHYEAGIMLDNESADFVIEKI
jgi:hypothetical protein